MKITSFTKPKGLITISAALILMIDPNIILHLLGVQLEVAGVMMTRILGGAYLVSGIGIWSINGPGDVSTREAWLYAFGEFVAVASVFVAVFVFAAVFFFGAALGLACALVFGPLPLFSTKAIISSVIPLI